MYSKIIGTGSYAPEKVLTNHDFEKMVDTSDQWITERTGIKERHILDSSSGTSDMAVPAAIRACEMAAVSPESLDLIICATITSDYQFPAMACLVQQKLGARNAASFDVQAACSGFLYGLNVANNFIKAGQYKRILVIGADALSTITNYKDRETCILFGDAAGAVVLTESDKPGILSNHLGCFADKWELLTKKNGGSKNPITKENAETEGCYIKMQGREIFKNAVAEMTSFCEKALESANVHIDEVAHIIPHQANNRIIEALAKKSHLTMERFVVNLQKYGNTSSASIPVALDEVCRSGKLKQDEYILTAAFGAGLTVASSLIQWRI